MREANLSPCGEIQLWSSTPLLPRRRETLIQPAPRSGHGSPSVGGGVPAPFPPLPPRLGASSFAVVAVAALAAAMAATAAAIRFETSTVSSGGMRHLRRIGEPK